jgi:hypothetical protein
MMRALRSLRAWTRDGVRVSDLRSSQARGADAYGLAEQLPFGPEREAAWAAYALQTYGDKLVDSCDAGGLVPLDTARVAETAFDLAAACLQVVRQAGAPALQPLPSCLPRWSSPSRTHEQLVGMKETLEDLRTYLAFELRAGDPASLKQLAAIDAKLASVALLWIEHAPPEIRGGIGDALTSGLDSAYRLGRRLARDGSGRQSL